MSAHVQQAYFAAVKSNFKVFLQQAFATIYPGKQFLDNWHIDAIVYCLEQGLQGRMPRLIINLPPRHLKSFIVSVAWPAFLWGVDPSVKVICVSYSDDLAKALSRDFKRIVESDWYPKVFDNVRLTKTTEGELVTDQGGSRYATSVGGTLTGRGADFIIIDDPIKPEDARSDRARNAVNDWYRSTLLSRLDDKQRSVLILVMQRIHVNDLTAFAAAAGGCHRLSLPAIAREDTVIDLGPKLKYTRMAGTALHSEYESEETLRRIRDDVGPQIFRAHYQQAPETPDGCLLKRRYFSYIDAPPRKWAYGGLYVSIDSALSTSESADYSAISLIYVGEYFYDVLSVERGRFEYEELKAIAMQQVKRFGKDVAFVIEAAGSGLSLISYLRSAGIACFHYHPRTDKMHRAALVLPIVAAGRVRLLNVPGKNAWVEPFINELVTFPHGRFDDQVDSLVQLISFAEQRHHAGRRSYAF